ncbi:MAG TPA: arsenate reductase (glutaredoxin) [Caulobacteraceae bacterium]
MKERSSPEITTPGSRGNRHVTIYHNPACGTSRNALEAIRGAGLEPQIVRYLDVGWRREQLISLLKQMGLGPRDILRVRGSQAEALGLTGSEVSDEAILGAMVNQPILVERPIVVSWKGAALCRPWQRVQDLL